MQLTEDKISAHLNNNSLLDITKYFYNSESVALPNDNRTFGQIFSNHYNNKAKNIKKTYNDNYLDYINTESARLPENNTVNTPMATLPSATVHSIFNQIKSSQSNSDECIIPTDLDLAYNLHWSDDSDDEMQDFTADATNNFNCNIPKIAYNAAIKCYKLKKPTSYMKKLIKQDDLTARLEDNIRQKISKRQNRAHFLLFIDRNGLSRFIKQFCNDIGKKLVKAHVTTVDGIILNEVHEVNTQYLVCFIEGMSLDTFDECKTIAIINTNFNEEGGKYRVFHFDVDKACQITYTPGVESDLLLIKPQSDLVGIPFPSNAIMADWLENWFNMKMDRETEISPILDKFIKSLPSQNRYISCILPVSLSDITLGDEKLPTDFLKKDQSMKKAMDMIKSSSGVSSSKSKLNNILYKDTTALQNRIETEKIYNHLEIDAELFNLIDSEIESRKINEMRSSY